jgi:hypothetical protein
VFYAFIKTTPKIKLPKDLMIRKGCKKTTLKLSLFKGKIIFLENSRHVQSNNAKLQI